MVDNWGQPRQERKPYHDNYAVVQQKCEAFLEAPTTMADTLPNAMVNHYSNTADYAVFHGIDLVPENKDLFAPFPSPWGRNLDHTTAPEGRMLGRTCDVEMDDKSTWSITRIGPMITTGGLDWVQIGWDDVFGLEDKLKIHPDGIYALEQISVPVYKDGTRIGNPPIHVHHIHVGPRTGVRQRTNLYECITSASGDECYDPTRIFEHHGDYQCTAEDGGVDCMIESVPDGYGKLITHELGLEGDLNDMRAANSEPLEWYYELGIRWVPRKNPDGSESSIKPMNFFNFAGPGDFRLGDQNTYIFTYQAPTDRDSVFWYTGRMPFSGEMLRNKLHAHNKIFKEAYFFAATPQELGLTRENQLMPALTYKTVDIQAAGFQTSGEVKEFVLRNLEQAQQEYDRRHQTEPVSPTPDFTDELHSRERPRIICQGVRNMDFVNGYYYDRREPTCCEAWHMERGDIFTVIGFHEKLQFSLGPYADPNNVPPTFPGHIGWWISTTNEEETPVSRFGLGMFTQVPGGGTYDVKRMSTYQRVGVLLNGGILSHHNTLFHDYYLHSRVLIPLLRYPLVAVSIGLILVALSVYSCTRNYLLRQLKKQPRHTVNVDTCDVECVAHTITSTVTKASGDHMRSALHTA